MVAPGAQTSRWWTRFGKHFTAIQIIAGVLGWGHGGLGSSQPTKRLEIVAGHVLDSHRTFGDRSPWPASRYFWVRGHPQSVGTGAGHRHNGHGGNLAAQLMQEVQTSR